MKLDGCGWWLVCGLEGGGVEAGGEDGGKWGRVEKVEKMGGKR